MTLGKIITLYREYKNRYDLEEKLRRSKLLYSDLIIEKKKEHVVAF